MLLVFFYVTTYKTKKAKTKYTISLPPKFLNFITRKTGQDFTIG